MNVPNVIGEQPGATAYKLNIAGARQSHTVGAVSEMNDFKANLLGKHLPIAND